MWGMEPEIHRKILMEREKRRKQQEKEKQREQRRKQEEEEQSKKPNLGFKSRVDYRSLSTNYKDCRIKWKKNEPSNQVVAKKLQVAEITEQDSLFLMRSVLCITLFNPSYIRGLFPGKFFDDQSVSALDCQLPAQIKKLMPKDTIIDWMEKGVYDAMQKKYLRTLQFRVSESTEGRRMMEEYTFSCSYPNSGATFKSKSTDITSNQIRSSTRKMVRPPDWMPEERTISMKLLCYGNATPANYMPPFFKLNKEQKGNRFGAKRPLNMEVGNVNSKHVFLALKVKGVHLQDDEEVSLEADSVVNQPKRC